MAPTIKKALGFRTLRPWTRHSLVLLVAGFVYVAIGITYAAAGPNDSRLSSMRLMLDWMPLEAWGVVFMLVGCASIISSRWPPASETWGYTAMTCLSAFWAGCYALGIPLGAPVQNISGVLSWGLVAFLWWAISGLVNPVSQKQRILVLTVDAHSEKVDAQVFDMDRENGIMLPEDGEL